MGNNTTMIAGNDRSSDLLNGVAATLRRLERHLTGTIPGQITPQGASRRLDTFQRSLARALQQAHMATVQELTVG